MAAASKRRAELIDRLNEDWSREMLPEEQEHRIDLATALGEGVPAAGAAARGRP